MTTAGRPEILLNGIHPKIYTALVSPYLKAKQIDSVIVFGIPTTCSICELLEADGISYTFYIRFYAFQSFRGIFFLLSSLCRTLPVLRVSLIAPAHYWRSLSRFNQQFLFAINDELRKSESRRNKSYPFALFRLYSFFLYLRFVCIYASLKLYIDDSPGLALISGHRCYRFILPYLAFGVRKSVYFEFGWPLFQSSPYTKNFKCFPGLQNLVVAFDHSSSDLI